jgi:hypothetical protein
MEACARAPHHSHAKSPEARLAPISNVWVGKFGSSTARRGLWLGPLDPLGCSGVRTLRVSIGLRVRAGEARRAEVAWAGSDWNGTGQEPL